MGYLGYYILDEDGNPIPEPDVLAWGRWVQENLDRKIIEQTRIPGDVLVSTVFLGIDHGFGFGWDDVPAPVLWETMIFGGPHDMYQKRYVSHAQAVEGHGEAVALAQSAVADPWRIAWMIHLRRWHRERFGS